MIDHPDFSEDTQPSKTRRKKDAHAQQELGERLTELPESVLSELPLSESLRAALREFQRIPTRRGAVKRQLQYIGRLIRDCDTEAIAAALAARQQPTATPDTTAEPVPSEADRWCDIVLQEGDTGIQQLVSSLPAISRQELRQLYRNYCNAAEDSKASARQRITECIALALDAE